MIADGKQVMKLFDLAFCTTKAGTPAASFVWETLDGSERTSYVLALTDKTGRPNHFGIQLTRRWATGWDGINLNWFRDNREKLLGTTATLTVRGGQIEWVSAGEQIEKVGGESRWTVELASGAASPLNGPLGDRPLPAGQHNEDGDHLCQPQPSTSTSVKTIRINLVVDLSKLDELPSDIEPNFMNAKALFDLVTQDTEKLDADKVWTLMAKKIGPMQIDFGEAEWQQMIDRIRQLRSWEGVVSC